MKKAPILLFIVLAGFLFCASVALAFEVEPMVVQMSDKGRLATANYTVKNDSKFRLPVEVHVFRRTFNEYGEEVLTLAEDDFLVLPPIGNIKADSFQTFKVKYVPAQRSNETISYRIVFEQLPIKNLDEGSGVKVLFKFGTLVFVSPAGVEPRIEASITHDKVVIGNSGTGVATMTGTKFEIVDSSSKTQVVSWKDLAELAGAGYLMPGQKVQVPIQEWYKLASAPETISLK